MAFFAAPRRTTGLEVNSFVSVSINVITHTFLQIHKNTYILMYMYERWGSALNPAT